jgi:predicted ester cyclase
MSRSLAFVAALAFSVAVPGVSHAQVPPATTDASVGTAAHNEWLARTLIERALNQPVKADRDLVIGQVVSGELVNHNHFVPPGQQGLQAYFDLLYSNFSHASFSIQDVVATKDKVVIRSIFTGVLTGPNMMGLQPKSQRLQVGVIDIWTVRDGKLYEHWDQVDWASVLAQAGVEGLPAPFYAVAGVTPPGAPR